jgi:ribonucleoside-diphosphate reductase alpha chain
VAGNVSSGIEPVFAWSYLRKVREPDGSTREEAVEDYALVVWKALKGEAPPPEEIFVTAQTLSPADHLRMQAAAQSLIDSSISKTVNCPQDIAFDAFAEVYRDGWRLGCKGLTTYRLNPITGSVLSVAPSATQPSETPSPSPAPFALAPRAEALDGVTYKIRWPESAHAVYVTINDLEVDGERRPFEIFINSKNMEHYAWTLGLTRMISAVFRRGGDVSFVAEELKAVFDPRGGAWVGGRYIPSLLAAIGGIIERHLGVGTSPAAKTDPVSPQPDVRHPLCPRCGAAALVRKEGCDSCLDCGYSKCG